MVQKAIDKVKFYMDQIKIVNSEQKEEIKEDFSEI